jgi:hypothetical protein
MMELRRKAGDCCANHSSNTGYTDRRPRYMTGEAAVRGRQNLPSFERLGRSQRDANWPAHGSSPAAMS